MRPMQVKTVFLGEIELEVHYKKFLSEDDSGIDIHFVYEDGEEVEEKYEEAKEEIELLILESLC